MAFYNPNRVVDTPPVIGKTEWARQTSPFGLIKPSNQDSKIVPPLPARTGSENSK